MRKILERDFYQRPASGVAQELLGKFLVREFEDSRRLVGRIVETEAYGGVEDLACHASKGRTKRTEVMFGPAGYAYVYLIYGIYHCFNIVTEEPGAAVLIRALEPVGFPEPADSSESGSRVRRERAKFGPEIPRARLFSSASKKFARVASGPGKLCRFMKIDKSFYGWDLTRGEKLWLEEGSSEDFEIAAATRIGVGYAGPWANKPWRFYIKDSLCVSSL